MSIINLSPGQVLPVAANTIQRNAYVYKSQKGGVGNNNYVKWVPNEGTPVVKQLFSGQTVTLTIYNHAGKIHNFCTSSIQVLY